MSNVEAAVGGLGEGDAFLGMVGRHPRMQAVFEVIRRVARTNATVLVTGESGTGKELVAHALHHLSSRAANAFVPVHCGAIPEELLESEMFGHERGAFTGATSSRIGRFKLADQGTIFLDEIGEMSTKLQVKLLRVIEDGRFEPVGGVTTQGVDVRIVAATNRALEEAVARREFREDLYYRLRVVPIEMPALRDRREDVPLLVQHVLGDLEVRGMRRFSVTAGAIEVLQRYPWPGNVRELRNVLEQLVVLGRAEQEIDVGDLPSHLHQTDDVRRAPRSMPWDFGASGIDFYHEMESIEDRIIERALRLSDGNKKEAARLLKLNRTTLLEKLKRKRVQGSPLVEVVDELCKPARPAPTPDLGYAVPLPPRDVAAS